MAEPLLSFSGAPKLLRELESIAQRAEARIGPALFRQGQKILTNAQEKYVPVDLGTLRASGDVEEPSGRGLDTSVSIVFGGPATPYALAVHETPSSHDPPSWEGKEVKFGQGGRDKKGRFTVKRGAKYLERPFLKAARTLDKDLAKDLDFELL